MNMLKVPLQIYRYKPDQAPHYDTFTVEIPATAHVIDAIDAVWAIHDQSLSFRRVSSFFVWVLRNSNQRGGEITVRYARNRCLGWPQSGAARSPAKFPDCK